METHRRRKERERGERGQQGEGERRERGRERCWALREGKGEGERDRKDQGERGSIHLLREGLLFLSLSSMACLCSLHEQKGGERESKRGSDG